jgi:hypothetical protein
MTYLQHVHRIAQKNALVLILLAFSTLYHGCNIQRNNKIPANAEDETALNVFSQPNLFFNEPPFRAGYAFHRLIGSEYSQNETGY